ncbi:MAG: ATP-binding protein [Rikenellaceae bacterium]
MSTRTIYYLLALAVFAIVGVSVWITVKFELGMYVVAVEALSVVVMVLLVALYSQTIRPLRTIVQGIDLLRTQDFNSRLLKVNQVEADQIVDLFNKMFDQLKKERMVARQVNQLLATFIDSSSMGVILMDIDDNISLINPAANLLLGYSEKSTEPIGSRIEQLDSAMAHSMAQMAKNSVKVIYNNDGNIYKCTASHFVAGGYNYKFYVVESMTEELLRKERETYEKVIRMISHEVNNSMAGVSSSLDAIIDSLADLDGVDQDVEPLLSISSERCLNLSHFISRFADVVKVPEPTFSKIPVDEFIENCVRMLESLTIDKEINFSRTYNGHDMEIRVDEVLMEQVMINIIKNAYDAVSAGDFISIETSCYPCSITVSNNGLPISIEDEQKLFSPFYSTKPNGQGVGLMLIKEILLKHSCKFELKTHKDGVTRFTIIFPTVY